MGKREIIKRKLKSFRTAVSNDYPIKKMIFFGSRAVGKPKRYSDIDLIIVSPKFRKMDFIQRGVKMYDYWNLGYPVDFLCYTPEEFSKLRKHITIVSEAIREGIDI